MTQDEDRDGLAAEYVLGTLERDEREAATKLIDSDSTFASLVADWERRLGELHAMVAPVAPAPELWAAIKGRLGTQSAPESQVPKFLDIVPVPPPSRGEPEPAPQAEVDAGPARRMRRWRAVSVALAAFAAGLSGLAVTAMLAPERLPSRLRPPPRVVETTHEVVRTVEVRVPAAAPGRFVAALQGGAVAPEFFLTVDPERRSLTIRRVAAEEQAGKSYELWLVTDRLPGPRSLGVIGTDEFTHSDALADVDPEVVTSALYGVSLEPAGGSPNGVPTAPLQVSGRLVEAVPAEPPAP